MTPGFSAVNRLALTLAAGQGHWDVARLLEARRSDAGKLPEREALWADLGSADAARAYRALGELASDPKGAVLFLKGRLRPVACLART